MPYRGIPYSVLDDRYVNVIGDTMTGALVLQNDLIIETANGLDVNPGADIDADLLTIGVTGGPILRWDESEDAFSQNKPIQVDASVNVAADVTIQVIRLSATNDSVGNTADPLLTLYQADTPYEWAWRLQSAAGQESMLFTKVGSGGSEYEIESLAASTYLDAPHFFAGPVRTGHGMAATLAQLTVHQRSSTAAKAAVRIAQDDVSEEIWQLDTTIGVGNAIEAVGAKVLTTTHFIKVTLPGGLTRYIPAGTIA